MANSKSRYIFAWTDDEVELLLKVTHEYKAVNEAKYVDWESSLSKYGDILERFREQYPSPEEAVAMGKVFPHKKDEITKGQLTTKLKAIRFKYRHAVDSGRKSGHGRVVSIYFECCESIWGGSPSTHEISEGIETGDAAVESTPSSPDTESSSSVPDRDRVAEDAVSAEMAANRRQRLDATPGRCRREKLKRKLSADLELCGSIWGGSPATRAISEGIETGDVAVEAVESTPSSPDTESSSVADRDRVAEMVANRRQRLDATPGRRRREKLKRKLSADLELCGSIWGGSPATRAISEDIEAGDAAMAANRGRREKIRRKLRSIAQENLDITRRHLRRLEATDEEFAQTTARWLSTMDRLNSNIELLVQRIVGLGTNRHTPPPSPHTTHQTTYSHGHRPTRRPPQECDSPAHGEHSNPHALSRLTETIPNCK